MNTIKEKIDKLKDLFDDYKNRNLNAISIYKLLINNYEQSFRKIRNFNLYNNININNHFYTEESKVYSYECLISTYNRLYTFYLNTNHIITEEYTNYYIAEKFCDNSIKKCIIINNDLIAYMYNQKLKNISFAYKSIKDSQYKKFNIFFEEFIKDIFPLNKDKFIYFDYSNNLIINEIHITKTGLEGKKIKKYKNINYYLKDLYINNKFFMIENKEDVFNIIYCKDEKFECTNLISKENKKHNNEYIINDIREIIDNSKINIQEKSKLKTIFVYNDKNDDTLEKLINMNEKFLKFFDDKNKDLYNKLRNKINNNEDKYVLNSNYIWKTFKRINNNLDRFNLSEQEKEDIKYILNLIDLCGDIMDIYSSYIIFNSKINNVVNYKNSFIFFMGDNYLINVYSLKEKKFFNLVSINNFMDRNNFKNFKIIQITRDKVIFNDSENKTIYFIENNNSYNFCLLKITIKYNFNFVIDNKYLLYDKIANNKLEFSFVNLSDLTSIENNALIELFNFKINYNIPKIMVSQEFKKIISVYDNNQLCIVDYTYKSELRYENNNMNINEINLIQDNNSEIIPPKSEYFSVYDDDYTPKNLFIENEYYCSKSNNNNENILFDFEKEYWLNKIIVTYIDKYQKSRIKKLNVLLYDKKKRIIKKCEYSDYNMEWKNFNITINSKCRYIKFELLENYGEKFFIIGSIRFIVDEIYSIN